MTPVFGIDFGTSNSALSVNLDNKVSLLNVDPENPLSNSLKSILYFIKEEGHTRSFVGYEGVLQYMENEAEGRYMQSVKTFLPDTGFQKTSIYGRSYTLEDLISLILKTMKERGQDIIGREVNHLVLGRPVIFSRDKERERTATDRLVRAARLAGFKEVRLQMEPVAAALAYESGLPDNEEQLVLVGDFGAGSSDFTVLRARKRMAAGEDRSRDILSVGGLYIGGDNFDSQIMRHRVASLYGKDVKAKSMFSDNLTGLSPLVLRDLMQWHHIPRLRRPGTMEQIKELKVCAKFRDKALLENLENLINANYGYLLYRAIETAKCRLSGHEEAQVRFRDYGMVIDEALSRSEFNEMIAEQVAEIRQCVEQTLDGAGLGPDKIDAVFLTGGSSYIPLVRSIFETRFGVPKIRSSDAFTSVAYGLGLQASLGFS
ncbi:Hsp70 family protein [Desulfospira joergensenii]|uniref:Hsp70 family protein n=1 Tax=Desulfospira joergensenii TaxID=53329 RepID=UPI0003B6D3CD|nr:Hsp70 family protein [Desulfospira joergensenii]